MADFNTYWQCFN